MPDPEATLAEMARVARRHLLVSVPREPLWRGLNMARGAYLRDLGNTPGHVNHWSKRAFVSDGSTRTARSCRRARPSRGRCCLSASPSGTAAPPHPPPAPTARRRARSSRWGSATTGVVTFAYFSLASHALDEDDYGGSALLWSVIFIIVSVIYRPVEQLLSRTIADRDARGLHHGTTPCGWRRTSRRASRLLFVVVALALRRRIQNDVFDGSTHALLGADRRPSWPTRPATSPAASWRATARFGLYGGLVLMESCSRFLFALAVTVGIAEGQSAVALGMVAAPLRLAGGGAARLRAARRPPRRRAGHPGREAS